MEFPKKFWLIQRYEGYIGMGMDKYRMSVEPPTEDDEGLEAIHCEVVESGKVKVTKTVGLTTPFDAALNELNAAVVDSQMKKWAAATVSVPQADGDPGPESGNSDAQGCNTGRIEDAKPCAEKVDRDYDIPF